MNLWFRLTLVCCVLVCLSMLLSLTQEVGLNQLLPIVASGPWLDVGREPASDAPTVSTVRSTEFDPARIGSLVPDCALSANNIGPPGAGDPQATGTDGALPSCRSSRQLKPTPSSDLSTKLLGFQPLN